jgi:hypothetical protein
MWQSGPYWQPDGDGDGLGPGKTGRTARSQAREPARAAVPTEQESTMTHNALALFVRAAMFPHGGKIDGSEPGTQDFRIGTVRAGADLRRPSPDDLDAENDYHRFLHAPRG